MKELDRYADQVIRRGHEYKVSNLKSLAVQFGCPRKIIKLLVQDIKDKHLNYTVEGIPYMTANGRRKTSKSEVTVHGRGSGKISINGQNVLYFEHPQDREQVVFPLQFTGLLDEVDVEAKVWDGGQSGQSGAVRIALALALRSFVDKEMIENMRIGKFSYIHTCTHTNDPFSLVK
ncbi:small ribosomal subunit protein uS9m-like isoform X4 [Oratosquilla oratoria]|uniref:small ribosomal subunit protein uS9m-like isoform X4 n=1 Tax=Oratosquilla oratoria TaxID=337810 RepID=UPI003F75A291